MHRPIVLLVFLLASCALAQGRWSVELYTGTSFHAPTTLEIRQAGQSNVTVRDVRYETRPWHPFESLTLLTENYYTLRVGYRIAELQPRLHVGAEIEFLHDKAYYLSGDDPAGVVQHFELSDGLNYLLANGVVTVPFAVEDAFPAGRGQLLARIGAGPVITKPASTIRGLEQGHDIQGQLTGYELTGPGFAAGAQARWFAASWLSLGVEAKASYAFTNSRIAEGRALTNVPSVHLTFGLGVHP